MDPANIEKIHLSIDFREQRSGIVEEIKKLAGQISFEIKALPTGDYWIGDKIIIERKTISDFLNSIKTGRIFQQAYRMAQTGKNGLIILEGDQLKIESGAMSREAVQGALLHITVFLGIPVIRSRHINETASLLIGLINQSGQMPLPRQKKILPNNPGIRIHKRQREKLFLLQNLPGVGAKKGMILLKSIGTIENIVNTSQADLMKIKGIGKKLAHTIFTIFHEPF